MKNYKELLFLKNLKGFGTVKINEIGISLINRAEDIEDLKSMVVSAGYASFEDATVAMKAAERITADVSCDDSIKVITVFDEEYPKPFNQMGSQKPFLIYVKGSVEILNNNTIGIIGTRKPSNEGASQGIKIAQSICEKDQNAVIVSGLALGCDTIGHMAALESGNKTVAVLPGGINKISPATNKTLANKIVEDGGCLISEYEPKVAATPYSFVRRDALIAALSDGLVVLQCGKKSGTMHTVEFAEKYNKRIAVYRGMFADGDFSGNMELLKSESNWPIKDASDVAEYFGFLEAESLEVHEQMSLFDL